MSSEMQGPRVNPNEPKGHYSVCQRCPLTNEPFHSVDSIRTKCRDPQIIECNRILASRTFNREVHSGIAYTDDGENIYKWTSKGTRPRTTQRGSRPKNR